MPRSVDPKVSVVTVPDQILALRSFTGLASEHDLAVEKVGYSLTWVRHAGRRKGM